MDLVRLLRAGVVCAVCCRALENDMAPILVVATNRGITQIRGTNYRYGVLPTAGVMCYLARAVKGIHAIKCCGRPVC